MSNIQKPAHTPAHKSPYTPPKKGEYYGPEPNLPKDRSSKNKIVILEPSGLRSSPHAKSAGEAADRKAYRADQEFRDLNINSVSNNSSNSSKSVFEKGHAPITSSLDSLTKDLMKSVTNNLRTIEKGDANVVNLSIGSSEIKLLEVLINQYDTNKAAFSKEDLKKIEKNGKLDFNAVEKYVDDYMKKAQPEIEKNKKVYEAEVSRLKELGIPVVVAGGNQGDTHALGDLPKSGFKFEKDESENILATKDAVVVGASGKDGTPKVYSSVSPLIDFSVETNSKSEGTSFAAPHFAGKLAELMEAGLTADEAIEQLKKAGIDKKDRLGNAYKFIPSEVMDTSHNLYNQQGA
jgi:hypothetical protein